MRAVVIVVTTLVVAACTREQATPAQGELVFRAKVANLGIQTGALAEGRSRDEEVELRLPGELFDPPLKATIVAWEESDRSSPVAASASAFSAFKADDADWILSNFAQRDQADVQAMLANEEIRARNGDASRPGLVEVFVLEDGEWKRTNALSADERFDLVWAAFSAGSITESRY